MISYLLRYTLYLTCIHSFMHINIMHMFSQNILFRVEIDFTLSLLMNVFQLNRCSEKSLTVV